MQADTFFSDSERKKISDTISEVEKTTSGEVAVMVVDRSDTYPEARILAGVLLGGLLSLIVTDSFFNASLWTYIPLTVLLALAIGWSAKFSPTLMRFFTPASHLEAQVEQRAVRAFYEKGLYKTRDASGVLFFLSLFEHKVWVLADKGIYSKIKPEELLQYADEIAQGVKQGKAADALCKEISGVGKILAEHFPLKPDDINELTNEILTE